MNTQVLNKLKALLIDFANKNGIALHDDFKSVEAFKTFVVSLAIKSLIDAGIETEVAYDFIMGDGSYNELAETVWNMHNA